MPSGSLVAMPTVPAAPASIEFSAGEIAAANVSPFTGQRQIQDWGTAPMECAFSLPPMTHAQGSVWVAWIRNMKGIVNYTQFPTAFASAYSESIGSRNWRLKNNMSKWSVGSNRMFMVSLEFVEATS